LFNVSVPSYFVCICISMSDIPPPTHQFSIPITIKQYILHFTCISKLFTFNKTT
jgi:hypothetical protein